MSPLPIQPHDFQLRMDYTMTPRPALQLGRDL
jgi:hypothetical protein